MGLSRIDEFCASLTASLGGEVTYEISTDSLAYELGIRVHEKFQDVFMFYLNRKLINNIRVADWTLHCVQNDESKDGTGQRMFMTFEAYANLISNNIRNELEKCRKDN